MTLRDWTVGYAPRECHVYLADGPSHRRTEHGRHELENVTIGGDGSTEAGIVIADAAGIERLRVSDYRAERPVAGAALSVVAGGFDDGIDGGYGAVLEDCRIDGDGTGIDVHGDNPPILVRGGSIRGASRRCPPAPGSITSAG